MYIRFSIFPFPFPTEDPTFCCCCMHALGPQMGGPFKGAYRAKSLNRTARAPLCAWEEPPKAAAPVPAHPQHGPFTVPSYGVRPGGYFLPTGAKGDTILNPFSGSFQPTFDPERKNPINRSKLTSAATSCGILGQKSRLEASKTGFGHQKIIVSGLRVETVD